MQMSSILDSNYAKGLSFNGIMQFVLKVTIMTPMLEYFSTEKKTKQIY